MIGVCQTVYGLEEFTAKSSGKTLKKRDITLVDGSNAMITLTLWNTEAENFNGNRQPNILLVKGARINGFGGGKTLSIVGYSLLNPDCPEAHDLRCWFDNGGYRNIRKNISFKSGNGNGSGNGDNNIPWLTFHEGDMKNFGNNSKPDYFQMKCTIQLVNEPTIYKSCLNCNKKLMALPNDEYGCSNCGIVHTFKYSIMTTVSCKCLYFSPIHFYYSLINVCFLNYNS